MVAEGKRSATLGGAPPSEARHPRRRATLGGAANSLTHHLQEDSLRVEAWEAVRKGLAQLRAEGAQAFAVRSSALSEDGRLTSFAGLFESVLDVRTNEKVRQAIGSVYRSR